MKNLKREFPGTEGWMYIRIGNLKNVLFEKAAGGKDFEPGAIHISGDEAFVIIRKKNNAS